jgi:hypothetical protein
MSAPIWAIVPASWVLIDGRECDLLASEGPFSVLEPDSNALAEFWWANHLPVNGQSGTNRTSRIANWSYLDASRLAFLRRAMIYSP